MSGPSASTHQSIVVPSSFAQRFADWMAIVKPRISLMVLITVTVGYAVAPRTEWSWETLLAAWVGIALVATASSAMNQWIEQDTDALMARTRQRPLPAGRMLGWEVFLASLVLGSVGCTILVVMVNIQTAILAAITWALYAGLYTPLKRVSPSCVAWGAIPGALPPVLGWAAAGAPFNMQVFSLFAILFLWQFPHFLAIAWKYREDYHAAGLKMLPSGLPRPHLTGIMATAYAIILLPVSLLPSVFGLAGEMYQAAALVAGCFYLAASIVFAFHEDVDSSRGLILTSLIYLPAVYGVLLWDHFQNVIAV